ncbi:nuclear pore complex protein NUP1-like [Nicotiana sylvestris]|uniref:Mucin-19-like n=1 Tax=Nicotiana sylvestris TaxID=4096 RepID=A0A1U7UW08_NICSY|nr:PREDICTED: mucin-19-like [Nicotiana sylvestris]
MAAAGSGGTTTSSAYEVTGGGAGGKFRKRPFLKKQTNPYDRPPTALRNPSWLTKLFVDPATKLITSGAQRFFSSLFRKRLLPAPTPLPLPPPEARQEPVDLQQESCPNDHAGAVVVTGHEICNSVCSSEGSAFSELEQLLKQKTFTRAEIDRLTELLHSKTVDTSVGNDKRAESIQYRPVANYSSSLLEKNRAEKVTSDAAVSTPATSSRVPKGDVASPAELAKVYMDTMPSKMSSSILSSQSQVVRVDTPLLKNIAYSQNLPITSVTTKTAGLVGVRANGFTTPRSRGRSAIYNMARAPYSRIRQTDGQMASSSTYNAYSRPSLSESVLEHDGYFGSKQPLKRRSSVLEDDLGSVGPMRRTRQKPNLLSNGVSRPSPGAGVASSSVVYQEVSKVVGDNNVPTRYAHIPSKSSETAAKILDHLEYLTPKKTSSESKQVAGKDKTPKKLTRNMLHGQALKSLESLDSPKLLHIAQDNSHKLENLSKVFPTDAHDSSLQKQGKIEQNGQRISISESTVLRKNDAKCSLEDAQHAQLVLENADSLDKMSAAQPQKKQAFRMTAHEDFFELDEDINFDESASQVAEGRDKMGTSDAEKKSLSTDGALNKPAAFIETKATLGILNKRNDMEAPDAAVISVDSTSFLPSANSLSPEVVPPSFGSNKSKEPSVDKVPALLFSSSPPLTGLEPESSSSLCNPPFGLASGPLELFESDNSQKHGKSNGKLEALSSGLSPSTSFAAPSSASSFSNGQFAPSPAISATSLLASRNVPKDVQSGSSSEGAPSTSISTAVGSTAGNSITSGSCLFSSAAASSVSTEPPIKFGLSEDPPTVSTLSTTSSADNANLKTKATNFGNLSSTSPFAGSSFASTSPGNNILGFSSPGMSTDNTASIQSQSSVFSTVGQSLVSARTSLAGSDNAKVSQTVPSHFLSSTSSPEVRNSGMTSFSTVGSASSNTGIVSAASSDGNPAGSSTAQSGKFSIVASSPASSTLGNSVGPSSGTTQLAFTYGASPAAVTTALATSSNATSGVFMFGVNSSSSSINAVDTSTRSSPGTFNFGGSSSASLLNNVSTSNGATPGVFSFGGGSSASSANTISTSASATPGVFSFGGGSSASSTNTVSTSTGATPGVFCFGGSSSASSNSVSTSTSVTPGVFGFGGSSSASSANTVSTSTGATPGVFSFGGSSSASSTNAVSTSTSATTGIFSFGGSSSASLTDVIKASTTASPGVFSFGGSTSVPSTNAVNASSTVSPNPFAFGATSASSQTSSSAGIFGSSLQSPKLQPGFSFSSSIPSGFTFGASSSFNAPSTTAVVFGSAPSTPSAPAFPFGSTSPTVSSSQPIFGNSTPFTAAPVNNGQMSMEDSMAEDPAHASPPAISFGQPSVSPSPGGFMFGSTPSPFQFGGQQSNAAAQNPSPFAASNSFGAGGSFSLGSSGPDKSGRRIIKPNRNKNRRK